MFGDIDSDDAGITKAATTSNPGLVNLALEGNNLTLSYAASLVLPDTVEGHQRFNRKRYFIVNVSGVDDDTILAPPITDIVVDEDAAGTTIDLSQHYRCGQ